MSSIGNINIKCPIRRRLVIIGVNHKSVPTSCTSFYNKGVIDIYGPVFINFGCSIVNHGHIVFRGNNLIGKQTKIDIQNSLEIGHDTSIGFETHIIDTDFHYTISVKDHRVKKNTKPIRIGNFNWIGSNCYLKRGTVTPDYLIAASPNTLLTKDYSYLPPYSVLAGAPAKTLKTGIRRIYNPSLQTEIQDFFQQNPDAEFFQIDMNAKLDELCKLS